MVNANIAGTFQDNTSLLPVHKMNHTDPAATLFYARRSAGRAWRWKVFAKKVTMPFLIVFIQFKIWVLHLFDSNIK